MNDLTQLANEKEPLSLDPANTQQGAMERDFLTETYGPQSAHYDASIDLP